MNIWPSLLDELEADAALACALAHTKSPADLDSAEFNRTEAWTLPTEAGPIPVELTARARQLIAVQAEAAALLGAAARETAALLAKPRPARAHARSVYMDVVG